MSPSDHRPNARSGHDLTADSLRDSRAEQSTAAAEGTIARPDLGDSGEPDDPSDRSDPSGSFDVSELWDAAGLYESADLVRALLDRVPEFAPRVVALVKEHDDDPGEPMVLIELADFIAPRLDAITTERLVVEAAMAFVETLLNARANDEVGAELFGAAFFDSFTPEDHHRLAPWLGPRARALMDALDAPPGELI
jgi:hypothetical protein